ncbi:hypothetical protein ACTFIW_000048 [Dictyostelium discoideum]
MEDFENYIAWKASGIDCESIQQHRDANKDKHIIPSDQTSLVLPGSEFSNNVCTLANHRQVGLHATSEDSINKFKITDTKKSTRGRNPKVLNQMSRIGWKVNILITLAPPIETSTTNLYFLSSQLKLVS